MIQLNLGAGAAGEVTTFNPTSAFVRIGGITKAFGNVSAAVNLGGTSTGNEVLDVISDGVATGGNNVSIIKSNTSTWTLSGANTYTGDTKVLGGTLSIANPYLADAADVYMSTGANFNLNFSGTDIIDSLFINNASQAAGTWGAIGSGAAHQTALITGTGWLQVTTFIAGLPGDFNSDGKVDAGDYATWRKNDGPNATLPNDNGVGNQAARFSLWRANFGNPPGSGSSLSGAGSTVPEPSTLALICVAAAFLLKQQRTRPANSNANV